MWFKELSHLHRLWQSTFMVHYALLKKGYLLHSNNYFFMQWEYIQIIYFTFRIAIKTHVEFPSLLGDGTFEHQDWLFPWQAMQQDLPENHHAAGRTNLSNPSFTLTIRPYKALDRSQERVREKAVQFLVPSGQSIRILVHELSRWWNRILTSIERYHVMQISLSDHFLKIDKVMAFSYKMLYSTDYMQSSHLQYLLFFIASHFFLHVLTTDLE